MIGRLAKGMYLFIVAVMIAAYAMSLTKSEPPPPADPNQVYYSFA